MEKKYAGLNTRGVISFWESGLISIPNLIGGLAHLLNINMSEKYLGVASAVLYIWVYCIHYPFALASKKQATFGGRNQNVYVTDINGNRLTLARAFCRTLVMMWVPAFIAVIVYFSSGMQYPAEGFGIFYALVGIGFIPAFFTEKKQAVHDLIAGTVVLHGNPK